MPIRRATVADALGIASVHVTAWQAAHAGLLPHAYLQSLSVESRHQMWQRILSRTDGRVQVYEKWGTIVGFVDFGPCRDNDLRDSHVAEIYAIYVAADHWGSGYGTALLDGALANLRSRPFCVVTLWVLVGNQRAIGFYEKAGFQADGAHKTETLALDVTIDELRYQRAL